MKKENRKLANFVGKTVSSIVGKNVGIDQSISIAFTDGTRLYLKSWDYEEYSSGISVRYYLTPITNKTKKR